PASPASDVYGLGCVAFECVAGGAPFSDRSLLEVGMAHLEEEPPDPVANRADLSPALGAALLTALVKEPEDRPSAGAYAEGLRAALGGGSPA
ncbi:MAG: serine/threonine-protein kinase, partial [Gaiellaceae bacterium]